MANSETLSIVTEYHLKPILMATFQRKTTPFIHAQMLSAGSRITASSAKPEVDTGSQLSSHFLYEAQRQLVSLDLGRLTFTEFLASFHELVAILLSWMLHVMQPSNHPRIPETLLDLWPRFRDHLYTTLPRTLSSDLSAWQAWCLAESARRSLLCVILIDGILEVVQKGFCHYRHMVESLPFDARTGLWEARSEEEWKIAVASHGGAESDLISWSEYIESGGPEPRKEYDGMIQRLLLVIQFGKGAAKYAETQSSRRDG